jgi:hypothetical protein
VKPRAVLIGEFFLIVLGVLVALGVETALKSRDDATLREEYLSRIYQDIEADRQAIQHRVDFFRAVQQFSDDILVWLGTDRRVDQEILLASFYAAEVWPMIPNRSTYDDLHSTGNIRLLKDIDLRTSISSYYNKADTSRAGWNPSEDYREVVRGIIPNYVQRLIRRNCPTTDEFDDAPSGFPPCELPGVDYNEISELFDPLKSDATFKRKLTYRDSELGVMVYLLEQQVVFANDALARIKAP